MVLKSAITTGVFFIVAHGPGPSPQTGGPSTGGGCAHTSASSPGADHYSEKAERPEAALNDDEHSHGPTSQLTAEADGLIFNFSPSTLYPDVGTQIEIDLTIEAHAEADPSSSQRWQLADATLIGRFVSVATGSMEGREVTAELRDGVYRFHAKFAGPGTYRFDVRLTDPSGKDVRATLPMSISASDVGKTYSDRPQRNDYGGGHSH